MKGNIVKILSIECALACLLLCGCGGGGSGSGSSLGGAGQVYRAEAFVTRDTCGERVSTVTQFFTISGRVLDTSLVKLTLDEVDGSLQGGFSESNGECSREYRVSLRELGKTPGEVTLRSSSRCSNTTCETEWTGTVTPTTEVRAAAYGEQASVAKVRGENCNSNVPTDVGYRPSLFECNGNAGVLLRGRQRNNYSVVVRRDGQFNDRDPRNPSCSTNRCSPYKTQKRIELPDYQVNCLGDSGFSGDYLPVNRISIKYTAQIENANDTSQFEQYCLADTQRSFN